jgi:small subunit ribosomal protein S16
MIFWVWGHIQGNGRLPVTLVAPHVKSSVKSGPFDFFESLGILMVVIRLARGGAKKRPFFNFVVADSRFPRDGRFIERLGFYDPKAPEGRERLRINRERLDFWKGKGALLSDTVTRLVKQAGEQKAA